MYYEAWEFPTDEVYHINVCYAESTDGINWHRPSLGIFEFEGSSDNNIIMTDIPDNIAVMIDNNPACPNDHRIKAVMDGFIKDENGEPLKALVIKASGDGIHFEQIGHVNTGYDYDSQNTLHYNEHTGKYYCYFRNNVRNRPNVGYFRETTLREIMVTESSDLVNWSEPASLDYLGGEIYPLYTNCVSAYPFDTRYYIGFPSRYVERREWTSNYDQLAALEFRKKRKEINIRYALAVTDCLFMSSEDNYHFYRFDEATMTAGPENDSNWLYGDCYPAVGGVHLLPARFEGDYPELSIYALQKNRKDQKLIELVRHVYRIDGFASYKADYRGKHLRTKAYVLEGEGISLNFRSSARGGLFVKVLDERGNVIEGYESCEYFGDSLDRKIEFEKPLSELRGKKICFEFFIKDAELFSMKIL